MTAITRINLRDLVRRFVPLLLLCVIMIGVVLFAKAINGEVFTIIIINMLVNMMMVIGLYLFVGNSGLVSFGNIGFVAIGAYVAGLLTIPSDRKSSVLPNLPHFLATAHTSFALATLAAAVAAACVAFVVGIPIVRLNGFGVGIASLAFLIIVHTVAGNWTAVTGGFASLSGVPTTTNLWNGLAGVIVCLVIAFLYQESRYGRLMRASREDFYAASSIGIAVVRHRLFALCMSAAVMGIGGAFFAHFVGTFSPDDFYLPLTILTLAMLVVGGRGSLAGAVIGTLAVTFVSESLTRVQNGTHIFSLYVKGPSGLEQTGLAVFLILVLIFRSNGIMGGRELLPATTEVPPSSLRSRQDHGDFDPSPMESQLEVEGGNRRG